MQASPHDHDKRRSKWLNKRTHKYSEQRLSKEQA